MTIFYRCTAQLTPYKLTDQLLGRSVNLLCAALMSLATVYYIDPEASPRNALFPHTYSGISLISRTILLFRHLVTCTTDDTSHK